LRQVLYHAILTSRGKQSLKKLLLPCVLLNGALAFCPCIAQQTPEASAVPPGAAAVGYTRRVIYLTPTTDDISYDDTLKNLYSGDWYDAVKPPSTYFMTHGILTLNLDGVLTTESRKSQPGALPLLAGSKGFYVEFAVKLSDNDNDHFPAVWVMPQEHNAAQSDHQTGDPPRYERWLELDVNEGGLGTNFSGTYRGAVIDWWGIYPHYERQVFNNIDRNPIDLTVEHVFGASYDPVGQRAAWWLDGVKMGSQSTASFPAVVNGYHYYLIMNAASRGARIPYQMQVRYLAAWTP
jgi:hypothetical protein